MDGPPKKQNRRPWIIAGVATMVIVAAVLFYKLEGANFDYVDDGVVIELVPPSASSADEAVLGRFAVGEMAALAVPGAREPATDRVFQTREGEPTRLADFRGRVVVVNLWATWCAPCLTEMPTLAALATAYADQPDLEVLPISVDVADQRDKAIAFMDGQPPLPFYNDPTFQLPFEFGARGGMPQTILLDRQGRVRASLTGGADWSGPEARALIDALLAEA